MKMQGFPILNLAEHVLTLLICSYALTQIRMGKP